MNLMKWLDEHLEEYILILLSSLTVVIVFSQVVMRYAFGESLSWSEELARYLFIWMIYIGVSFGVKKGKHLGVDAFPMMFGTKGKTIIQMIACASFFLFALVMTIYGFDIVLRVTRESAAMELPLGWVYAAPVVGMVLTSIRLVQEFLLHVKTLKQPNHPSIKGENELREEIV